MTDDIDTSYTIRYTRPLRNGTCPTCGLFLHGFSKCYFCGWEEGEVKVVRKERRWVGKVEIG